MGTITPYDWQQPEIDHIAECIRVENIGLSGSDTGIGKTVIGLAVAKKLGLTPLIICPKAVKSSWRNTADAMGIDYYDVQNVEALKTGKKEWLSKHPEMPKRYIWTVPDDTLLICDEVHRFGGQKSQNAYLLAYTKTYKIPVLALSATVADSPLKMKALGFLMGLHNFQDFTRWAMRMGAIRNGYLTLEFTKGPRAAGYMKKIHDSIYPRFGHRIRIADLDHFAETTIYAEAYDLGEKYTKQVAETYKEMDAALLDPKQHFNPLTQQLRARQRAELFKVHLLKDLIEEHRENGFSIVVFVSFKETLDKLKKEIKEPVSVIQGGQKEADRDSARDRFLSNETRVCLCMIQAGGVGLDLDDKDGEFPRITLITPSYSGVELRQALGRVVRASTKSKSVQYILFAAGTVEDRACQTVRKKLSNIDTLNDGDLAVDEIQTKENT